MRIVWAFVIVAAILMAAFMPFFPGGYDALSKPLSGMALDVGRGLLLLPVAATSSLDSIKSQLDRSGP